MSTFGELLDRVQALTQLEIQLAIEVAKKLWGQDERADFTPAEIVDCAIELGYDVERKHSVKTDTPAIPGWMSMDPAQVLTEVYENSPRVMCSEMPKLGRAPAEAMEHFAEELSELPEDVRAMLVKIDLHDMRATYWLRDEANAIDRPIGPIDLSRYQSEHALGDALMDLFKRLGRVLAADFN